MGRVDCRPGHKYFFTLFVRDSRHGTISVYGTVEETAPGEAPPQPPMVSGIRVEGFII